MVRLGLFEVELAVDGITTGNKTVHKHRSDY